MRPRDTGGTPQGQTSSSEVAAKNVDSRSLRQTGGQRWHQIPLHELTECSPQLDDAGATTVPILQMRKPRFGEVKGLAQVVSSRGGTGTQGA